MTVGLPLLSIVKHQCQNTGAGGGNKVLLQQEPLVTENRHGNNRNCLYVSASAVLVKELQSVPVAWGA